VRLSHSSPPIGQVCWSLPLTLFCLYRGQLGLAWGGRSKLIQEPIEHSPAVLRLLEMDTQPDEHIHDFPVAGLQRSFKGAEGPILGFRQLGQDVAGDDLRGLN